MPESDNPHHLIVERTEFLEERIPFRLFFQDPVRGIHIWRIGIILLRKRFVYSGSADLFRNCCKSFMEFCPEFRSLDHLFRHFIGKEHTDLFCLRSKIRMPHISQHRNRSQHHHDPRKTRSPSAEHSRHFLLVSVASASRCSIQPAGALKHFRGQRNNNTEQIEITEILNIERIQKTFARNTIAEQRRDFLEP